MKDRRLRAKNKKGKLRKKMLLKRALEKDSQSNKSNQLKQGDIISIKDTKDKTGSILYNVPKVPNRTLEEDANNEKSKNKNQINPYSLPLYTQRLGKLLLAQLPTPPTTYRNAPTLFELCCGKISINIAENIYPILLRDEILEARNNLKQKISTYDDILWTKNIGHRLIKTVHLEIGV